MAKNKTIYECTECHERTVKWVGKCPKCEAWGTLEEKADTASVINTGVKSSASSSTPTQAAARVKDIEAERFRHQPTGIGEFDRVLGGGLVPGGVMLLAGAPGTGKSTLLLQVANTVANNGSTVLIISGEESREQIALRAKRVGATSDNLYLASESDLSKALGHIESVKPGFIIIDSVQTIASPELDGRVGEKAQVTEVSTILTRLAKNLNTPMIMIGHENKDGNIAGPRVMEHLVDVVLHFEGDRDTPLKFLRGIKNRYGASDEVGCFEHHEDGIREVADPSGLLLGRRDEPVAGVSTSITLEGKRPLPVEVQSLVAPSPLPVPRKATSGLDSPRAVMLQAVVERHGGVRLSDKDVYLATIGGMRTREPAVDLSTAIALASGALDIATPVDLAAVGEITLAGEVRRVPGIRRRAQESLRLGFTKLMAPAGTRKELGNSMPGLVVIEVNTVKEMVDAVRGMA